jgi:LAS superfamily LD-carboxypeptidase LdcB
MVRAIFATLITYVLLTGAAFAQPGFGGLQVSFAEQLKKAFAAIAGGACKVGSGFRSHLEQIHLWHAKPGLAARPGHSNHERGLAADLSCSGGALGWMHRHAASFGLRFPMSWEAWHIEPVGATRVAYAHHHRAHYASRHRYHYAHHYRWRHRYAVAG